MNPMREIRLEKVTLNMGAGEAGPKLEKCKKIMELLTGKKVVITKTRKRTTFMAKNRPIGVKTVLRGKEAVEILKRLLEAVENKIKESQFDENGNFSFGIKEYIHIPGMKYDPDIGILGLDVCVTVERPGYRVKKRRIRPGKIGKNHRITKQEAIEWAKKFFGIEIEKGE